MAMLSSLVKRNSQYYADSYYSRQNPIELNPTTWNDIPVIDLPQPQEGLSAPGTLVRDVKEACQKYGMFKVANHGIKNDIMTSAMRSVTEYFNLLPENEDKHCPPINDKRMLYSSSSAQAQGMEGHRYWRDNLQLARNTTKVADGWPTRPHNFRNNLWNFGDSLSSLEDLLLRLIIEGLDINDYRYFDRKLREDSYIMVDQFPPCPKPERTNGLPKHCDRGILTISLLGDVPGTQIFVDGEWKQVAPCMETLLVTVGHQLQVISNGIFKAPIHREVVNSERARSIISYMSQPSRICTVGPAKYITKTKPARYNNFRFNDYYDYYTRHLEENADTCTLLERYYERK